MRKNSRNNTKRERIIMIASSAFVLTALTMTGIYMKSNNEDQMDDGYTIDFTALEDNVQDKYQEIAQNGMGEQNFFEDAPPEGNLEDDLDYMPMEVGSGLVELPGLTNDQETDLLEGAPVAGEEQEAGLQENVPAAGETYEPVTDNTPIVPDASIIDELTAQEPLLVDGPVASDAGIPADITQPEPETDGGQTEQPTEDAEGSEAAARNLHYAESEGLLRPVGGEVLIPYSMDSSVYFTTLAQYKYNSALMLVAQEDAPVRACAEGRVVSVFENEEIGHAVTMELGDGYQITYGQLKNITVLLNDYVDAGQTFAQVAAPTKYFCLEGSNLYLRLTVDGNPVNPEALFR